MSPTAILDIGCGARKTPGAVGMDIRPLPGVDIVHDLNIVPWPVESDRFDLVVAKHALEHLVNLDGVMEEIRRVSRNGARLRIVTPHFSSLNSWEDPSHVRHFARRSFSFFSDDGPTPRTPARFKMLAVEVSFGKGLWDMLGRLHYRLWPDLWEKQLAFIHRARNMTIEMEVVKQAPCASA